MTDPARNPAATWLPVPWSDFPARFREDPEQWPHPQQRSTAVVLAWGVGVFAVSVFLVLYLGPWPFERSLLNGQQVAVLWFTVPFALFFGATFIAMVGRPYFPKSSRADEVVQKTRVARRETLRAIRRAEPIPAEREPLVRLWIASDRMEIRQLAQTGLLVTSLLLSSATEPSWLTAAFSAGVGGFLVVVAEALRRERAVRLWMSGRGSVDRGRVDGPGAANGPEV